MNPITFLIENLRKTARSELYPTIIRRDELDKKFYEIYLSLHRIRNDSKVNFTKEIISTNNLLDNLFRELRIGRQKTREGVLGIRSEMRLEKVLEKGRARDETLDRDFKLQRFRAKVDSEAVQKEVMVRKMQMFTRLLLLSALISDIFCRINVENLADSGNYYRQGALTKRARGKFMSHKGMLKCCKEIPTSREDDTFSNNPFRNIQWNEFISEIDIEDPPVKLPKHDNLPVLEASKKYGLPSVIEKCVTLGDIALTFDDGVSTVTQEVLNILRRENVKATFFVLGNTLDSPNLGESFAKKILNQMVEDGHVVASHSYSHPDLNEYWPEGIQHEMNRSRSLFQKHIGRSPRFMRPPFGNTNARSIKALNDLGYFIIRWNVDTNDWMYKDAPEKSLTEFGKKLPEQDQINSIRWQKSGLTELGVKTMINGILDSKIALMHDIHSGIIKFLPRLINHARNLGYRFVAMDECLGGINPYFEASL